MKTKPERVAATALSVLLAIGGAAAQGTEQPPAEEPAGSPRLSEVLEGASGVRVATMCTNCNVASVTMLGQSGDRVQVWQDGLSVMGGLGAIYLLSVLPSEAIGSTEIIRGAGTVLSGSEASAGAVVIRTREAGRKPFLSFAADAGGLDWRSQKLYGTGRLGRWGGEIAATHASSGGSDANDDGNFDLASFRRTTAGGAVSFELREGSILRAEALSYREDQEDGKGGFSGPVEPTAPDFYGNFYTEDIEIRRNEFGLSWEHAFQGGSRLSLRTRYSGRDQLTSDSSTTAQPYMTVDETVQQAEARYEWGWGDRTLLTAGALHRRLEVAGVTLKRSPLNPQGQVIDDEIEHDGAYAQAALSLPRRVDLTLGVRWDDYGAFGSRGSPRMKLAWKPMPELALALSAGYGFAAPRPVFERVCCGALVTSNAEARPEVSRNLLLDADAVPWRWLKLRGSLFRNDVRDYLQKTAWWAFSNYIPSYMQVNYPHVEMEGAELGFEVRPREELSFGAEATRLRARSTEPVPIMLLGQIGYYLPEGRMLMLPQDQGAAFVKWDDARRGTSLSVQGQYTGAMLIQAIERAFGPVDTTRATPSFWTFNVRARQRVHRNVSVFAGVDNLTDESQLWLDDPRYEYNWGPLRGRYVYGGLSFEM